MSGDISCAGGFSALVQAASNNEHDAALNKRRMVWSVLFRWSVDHEVDGARLGNGGVRTLVTLELHGGVAGGLGRDGHDMVHGAVGHGLVLGFTDFDLGRV